MIEYISNQITEQQFCGKYSKCVEADVLGAANEYQPAGYNNIRLLATLQTFLVMQFGEVNKTKNPFSLLDEKYKS